VFHFKNAYLLERYPKETSLSTDYKIYRPGRAARVQTPGRPKK